MACTALQLMSTQRATKNGNIFGGNFVWSHRFQNMIILVAFILFFRFATFYALERINYSTR